jgi:serine-type D-Ala-D-Ala carboxypeptidase (penicillin-binding protein 5/6)
MRQIILLALSLLVAITTWGIAIEPVNSYVVVEHYTGKILAQKNGEQQLPVASLTKMATGCVVLDWAKATKTNLGQFMAVPPHAPAVGGANPLNLQNGDQMSLRDGLYASLMSSDNVAAESLAYHVGIDLLRRRGKRGDPMAEFIRELNALAGKLRMTKTKFVNAHGLDHNVRKQPYSTSKDMARLARYAMDKGDFRFYVSQKSRKVKVSRLGKGRVFGLKNTNKLVGQSRIDGVKTGQTTYSGPCLIVSATKPNQVTKQADGRSRVQKRRVTVVVLAAQDRFRTGKQLLDWGWREYDGWNRAGRPMNDRNGVL